MRAYVIFGDGTRVDLEVADTDEARARGLMFRDALDESHGMLFCFDAARRHPFWMKHVRFALDILWLDARNRIVWLVEDAPPCQADPCTVYEPRASAASVLEVAGGFAQRHGVALGDVVTINQLR